MGTKEINVGIIGAGPSGLVAAKELKEVGCKVVIFEKQQNLGGVYAALYDQLRLTTSNLNVAFSSYYDGIDIANPQMWDKEKYINYLSNFAQHFSLLDDVRFSQEVTEVSKDDKCKKWRLCSHDDATDQNHEYEFDHIAVCSGVNSIPTMPNWPGMDQFTGKIIHTVDYKNAADFKNKNVLLVGLGESGSDIALQIAKEAKTFCISTRNGPGYLIPRYFGGQVTDLDTNRCYHSFPHWLLNTSAIKIKRYLENLYSSNTDDKQVLAFASQVNSNIGLHAFQRFGTKNLSFIQAILYHNTQYRPDIVRINKDHVQFIDGSTYQCDVIICCTGFRAHFPFLKKPSYLNHYAANSRSLFKRMIVPIEGDSLAFIGFVRPGVGSIPPCSEMQARYFAQLVSKKAKLPPMQEMQTIIQHDKLSDFKQYPLDAQRVSALTDYLRFLTSMAKLLHCNPSLKKLFFISPKIWFKVMFGPITGIQFRLTGLGATPREAKRILKQIPTMPKLIVTYEYIVLAMGNLLKLLRLRK